MTNPKEKTLALASGRRVTFKYPILEEVEIGGVIIVCLEVPPNQKFNENVYGVDQEGTLLWQIKPVKHLYENSCYTGIANAEGRARLFNWDGMVYDVDPKTGEVVSSYFGK